MWTDYFYKFPDEKTALEMLPQSDIKNSIDILGDISTEDNIVSGWHVNIRTSDYSSLISLKEYEIDRPLYPKRVFFDFPEE